MGAVAAVVIGEIPYNRVCCSGILLYMINCTVLIVTMKMLCFIQEMQQSMNMLQPQQQLPDAAEMLTKWFGGGSGGRSSEGAKKTTAKSRAVRNR